MIDDIVTLARNFRWLELSRSGSKLVSIAARDHTTTRNVQAGITAALAIEEDTGQRILKPIKLPKEREPPYSLEPLVHMNGVVHTESVCPKHPGKRLVAPGITEQHSNPLYARWNQSNFCCLSCMRSGQDRRITRNPKDDPPRIALPEKPKAKLTRKERRAAEAAKKEAKAVA